MTTTQSQPTASVPTAPGWDPRARAVAQAVYDAVQPVAVILFGSRARGDYREDSDVDLLLVCRRLEGAPADAVNGIYMAASRAAHRKAEQVYGRLVGVDVVQMGVESFAYGRRAKNHVAGQAARDGVMVCEAAALSELQPDGEPTNWPDIRRRFIAATRNLVSMQMLMDGQGPIEDIGFHAQQAVENALKGWISALDDHYGAIHDLMKLVDVIRKYPAEDDTPAGEELNWLTNYAVVYRYEGARVSLSDPPELLVRITQLTDAIGQRIEELTGGRPPRWAGNPE